MSDESLGEREAKRHFEILDAKTSSIQIIGFAWLASYFGADRSTVEILFALSLVEMFIALVRTFGGVR